jgi:hypothetical protein
MILNTYFNSNPKYKRKPSELLSYKNNINSNTLKKSLLVKTLNNKLFSNSTPKFKNYINYTFLDKNRKFIHKAKSSIKFQKNSFAPKHNKNIRDILESEYKKKGKKALYNLAYFNSLKSTKEDNTNYKTTKNSISNKTYNNDYYKEEIFNSDNLSKLGDNISFKDIDKFYIDNIKTIPSKLETNDFFEITENSVKTNGELKNLYKDNNYQINYNLNNFNINTMIKFKSSLPIFKRINILKEVKSSIDKIKKNKFNNSSSFKTMNDESLQSKINNYSSEKNKYKISTYRYKSYHDNMLNKKPIIIKHMPKPKLSVPKYKNINNIQIFKL